VLHWIIFFCGPLNNLHKTTMHTPGSVFQHHHN
jgi:hypothetical protein